ncbi:MAG TPA: TrkH family potassium uptake protein [Candidatus Anaerostipes excrementavium]|uniref:TrkH family potassium uptake protein n=1 Tax=Candidatus Anaerostipes excrementavium TaxID=2838463 RepID=A0A9D1WX75_9FIRM|nr:TrkH family potassium uptake protein [uncultured Anaerostipes sp.]HIX68903.1 TrkH family potassium uptake protein [Candidatus Anaerostipes excrementavium]
MNLSMIRYVLGLVMMFEGAFLSLPCVVALIYQEKKGFSFFIMMIICLLLGFLLRYKKPKNHVFYAKEGFVTVAASWIVLSFFGGLPFVLNGDIPSVVDAMFETVSGFTTTGSSILSDVEALSKCSLFWRSFTHWIGGMGVFVFVLAVMPLTGGQNIHLMRAESPGPSVGKLVPKLRTTSMILYKIYFVMTVIMVLLLLAGRMPLFESLLLSFGAAGTGGFGILNTGCATYTPYVQYVIAVFMILFGVNFNVYYFLLIRRFKEAIKYEELKYYLLFIGASVTLITVNICRTFPTLEEAFRHAFFQVSSIITTTGYSSFDFNGWPEFSKVILILLMFSGACAGSTGGGIKVSRLVMMLKTVKKELLFYAHPRNVRKVKFNGRVVEHEVIRGMNVYFVAYGFIMMFSVLILALDNFDFTTNFTAVVATLNNIGPGLSAVGPASNFGAYSDLSKIVMIFDMLAGRLEIFPMLVLLSPYTWKGLRLRKRK